MWAQGTALVGEDRIAGRATPGQRGGGLASYLASFFFPWGLDTCLIGAQGTFFGTSFFFPWDLAVYYPYNRGGDSPLVGGRGPVGRGGSDRRRSAGKAQRPYLLVGWLWFLGMMVPVIGLVQVSWQSMADRYTYLPQIGLAIACGFAAEALLGRRMRARVAAALAAVTLAALMVAAFRQASYWQNSLVLWTRALQCTHGNDRSYFSMGHALQVQGRLEDAIRYRESLQSTPAMS